MSCIMQWQPFPFQDKKEIWRKEKNMGLIHIYTGDGKGKTSAAVGLAVRMAGRGGRVVVARFLKTENSGEVAGLRQIKGVTVIPLERTFGFLWNMTEEEKKEAADYYHMIWEQAENAAKEGADLLVLDEMMAAWRNGLVDHERILSLLDHRPERLEIVMTGRDVPEELMERADYITEMRKIRHPFDKGISARKGIEY